MVGTWDIEARGLTKAFGLFTAVRNLNLRVPRGTIFGFLGPNGSGKSTTVKLLTGLLTPTEGDALIAGEPVAVENVALKRKIGVLPEDDALFRALTIWEHLEMSGPLYGLKPEEDDRHSQLAAGRATAPRVSAAVLRNRSRAPFLRDCREPGAEFVSLDT